MYNFVAHIAIFTVKQAKTGDTRKATLSDRILWLLTPLRRRLPYVQVSSYTTNYLEHLVCDLYLTRVVKCERSLETAESTSQD